MTQLRRTGDVTELRNISKASENRSVSCWRKLLFLPGSPGGRVCENFSLFYWGPARLHVITSCPSLSLFLCFSNSIQNWSCFGPLINLSIVPLILFIPSCWDKARRLLWCDWSDSHSRFITSTLSSSSLINTIWSFWRITASPTASRTSCWTRTMSAWSTVCTRGVCWEVHVSPPDSSLSFVLVMKCMFFIENITYDTHMITSPKCSTFKHLPNAFISIKKIDVCAVFKLL